MFLDRDGTVIEQVHYLSDPAEVRLIPGVPEALRRLKAAGYALVIVTNQSAIGRGMLTVEQLGLVNDEMNRQLAAEGLTLDGIYYCPEAPSRRRPDGDHPRRPEARARDAPPGLGRPRASTRPPRGWSAT